MEREKRQNQQYSQDMEAEMEKRDQELEKRETEIFEMMEKHQRQLSQIENLKVLRILNEKYEPIFKE